jgi:transcriptional regulator
MFVPGIFKEDDTALQLELMRRYPFATVITPTAGGAAPWVGHLPILAEPTAAGTRLTGHFARANPQWHSLASGQETLFVFHGPHSYVSPSWYTGELHVPTWNYAVVHAYARPRLVEDPTELHELLGRMVTFFEQGEAKPWRLELPTDFERELSAAIVGFEAIAERIEGKFKLSQNREPADREGVIRGLQGRADELSRAVRELMARTESPTIPNN